MRISIFETSLQGHRPLYLAELIKAFSGKAFQLQLLLPESSRSTDLYRHYLLPEESMFRFCSTREVAQRRGFAPDIERLRILCEALRENPTDHVILPYGNGIAWAMAALMNRSKRFHWPASTTWDLLLMRTHSVYPQRNPIRKWIGRLERRMLRKLSARRILFSDRHAFCVLRPIVGPRARWLPELMPSWTYQSRSDALDHLLKTRRIDATQRARLERSTILGSPGVISIRKGSDTLLEAFVRLQDRSDISLLLSSTVQDDVRSALQARRIAWQQDPRIIWIGEDVDEETFQALTQALDIVCLPYRNHRAVSAVFMRSVLLRQRTLLAQDAWLGWASEHYQHGVAVDTSSPERFERHLRRSLDQASWRIASEQTAGEVATTHAPEHFHAVWREGLEGFANQAFRDDP